MKFVGISCFSHGHQQFTKAFKLWGVAKSVNLHGGFGDSFLLMLFYQVNIQPIAVWKNTTNVDFDKTISYYIILRTGGYPSSIPVKVDLLGESLFFMVKSALCLPLCFPVSLDGLPACLPDVFSQMWSPHCLPSCFPVVFWMSKRCGLPIVSHCPALVSRFPAVSQMWSPTCLVSQLPPVVLQMSSDCLLMVFDDFQSPSYLPDGVFPELKPSLLLG